MKLHVLFFFGKTCLFGGDRDKRSSNLPLCGFNFPQFVWTVILAKCLVQVSVNLQ